MLIRCLSHPRLPVRRLRQAVQSTAQPARLFSYSTIARNNNNNNAPRGSSASISGEQLGARKVEDALLWVQAVWRDTLAGREEVGAAPRSSSSQPASNNEGGGSHRSWTAAELTTALNRVVFRHLGQKRLPLYFADSLWRVYDAMGGVDDGQETFLTALATLTVDLAAVKQQCDKLTDAIQGLRSGAGTEGRTEEETGEALHRVHHKVDRLARVLAPIYERWFHESVCLPGGLKRLIDLRADVNNLLHHTTVTGHAKNGNSKQLRAHHPLRPLFNSLTTLLQHWFCVSWLQLQQLSWDATPPSVLQKVMKFERVRPVATLEELSHRIAPTRHRRGYAFFHPAIPAEPLVAVQVALTHGCAGSVQRILQHSPGQVRSSEPPDTAMFYSINATQPGLRGIELGNILIKRIVEELGGGHGEDGRCVKNFFTLSPIPLYSSWLRQATDIAQTGVSMDAVEVFLNTVQQWAKGLAVPGPNNAVSELVEHCEVALSKKNGGSSTGTTIDALIAFLRLPQRSQYRAEHAAPSTTLETQWWSNSKVAAAAKAVFYPSVDYYLTKVKRRGRIYDPVGNFHVKNGAAMHRLNWLGDTTVAGSAASACVSVNYHYDLPNVASNATIYELNHVVRVDGKFGR